MTEPWFKSAFKKHYLQLYAHRSREEAKQHLPQIIELAQLNGMEGRILDLGCGNGRYSELLRLEGHRVTGLDYSEDLLNEAQRLQPQAQWLRGNMLNLPFDACFERVLSLFTSFGYFDGDDDNLQVINNMAMALKEGGLLYLDFLNPGQVEAADWSMVEQNGLGLKSKKSFERKLNMIVKDVEVHENNELQYRYQERVKLYEPSWFESAAEACGLEVKHRFGDYSGAPFENNSPRQITVFTKP